MSHRPSTIQPRRGASLLLGPTGSGKTPLGELIESRGLWGQEYVHFDFGENLRAVVAENRPSDAIGQEDIDFLREVLASGALLEDEHFPIARRILVSFLQRRSANTNTRVLLNGLPRHTGQAQAIAELLDIDTLVHLDCTAETTVERIRTNVGGDRTDRNDDELEAVRNKLKIYHERTSPLIDFYEQRGARIISLVMTATMTPERAWESLAAQ